MKISGGKFWLSALAAAVALYMVLFSIAVVFGECRQPQEHWWGSWKVCTLKIPTPFR